MSLKLIQFNELMQDLIKDQPLEEDLSHIVRGIENEFNFNSFGIFLQVPKSEIFRLKTGRNLSHTFFKNTIFTKADPLITDLQLNKTLNLRSPGKYIFEHEYSHLIISSLHFNNIHLGFLFMDRSEGFYDSEELAKLHTFAALISMVVFLNSQNEVKAHNDFDKQQVPVYNHTEFIERGQIIFAMMKRYKRYLSMVIFTIDSLRNLIRIHGEKKTGKYLECVENIFAENLRETDFIGLLEKDTIAILMPETSSKNTLLTLDRIKAKMDDSAALKFGKIGWGVCSISDEIKTFNDMIRVTSEAAFESARRLKGEPQIIF